MSLFFCTCTPSSIKIIGKHGIITVRREANNVGGEDSKVARFVLIVVFLCGPPTQSIKPVTEFFMGLRISFVQCMTVPGARLLPQPAQQMHVILLALLSFGVWLSLGSNLFRKVPVLREVYVQSRSVVWSPGCPLGS